MSAKDKLRKFQENETFRCLFQPATEEVLRKDYRLKGAWNREVFRNDHPIILELGCGKGEYTISLAEKFPDTNFIGIDIKGARLWKGAKYVEEHGLQNAAFIRTRIEFIESLFAPNEIAGIWITFPDPQIKKARKRLTSVPFLNRYKNFLVPDGIVHLKTDSRFLHEYTAALALRNRLTVLDACTDIYGTDKADEILSIRTFYETYFLSKGFPITYLRFRIDNTEPLAEPQWDEKYWKKAEQTTRVMEQKPIEGLPFLQEITQLRHRIHQYPETSGNEQETARTLIGFLKACHPDKIYTEIGGHGMLALFRGNRPGPSRMFRCETDALPIREENGFSYRSRNDGAGHLCGHDGHMAILCGVARALCRNKQEKGSPVEAGEVYLLFQPAEETGEGAKKTAEELSRLHIGFDYSFALHNKPGFPLHTVIINPSTYAYASTGMEVAIEGHTAHACSPHLALNPSDIFLDLARFLKKYDAPGTLATVVNLIIGEPAYGTTPGSGIMRFTLRADTDPKLEEMKKETEREIRRLCEAEYARYLSATGKNGDNGFKVSISYPDSFPATINSPLANRIAEECARELGLPVMYAAEPEKGSDDFAYFTRNGEAAFFDLGAGRDHTPLHHPRFDFEDLLIPDGINMILKIIEKTAH